MINLVWDLCTKLQNSFVRFDRRSKVLKSPTDVPTEYYSIGKGSSCNCIYRDVRHGLQGSTVFVRPDGFVCVSFCRAQCCPPLVFVYALDRSDRVDDIILCHRLIVRVKAMVRVRVKVMVRVRVSAMADQTHCHVIIQRDNVTVFAR